MYHYTHYNWTDVTFEWKGIAQVHLSLSLKLQLHTKQQAIIVHNTFQVSSSATHLETSAALCKYSADAHRASPYKLPV